MTPEERETWLTILRLGAIPWLCFLALRFFGVRFFRPQRNRAVPWGGLHVATVFLLFAILLPVALNSITRAVLPEAAGDDRYQLILGMQSGLITVIFLPALIVKAGWGLPYQMGFDLSHVGRNILLGLGAYLLALPLVAIAFLAAASRFDPQRHRLENLVRESPTLDVLLLGWFVAVVLAPVQEELLFRGILLPWLRRTVGAWPAIVTSSLIFAALHAEAWPSPIPLFVLALFLGYLAYRTSSLVAPVVLHATFNAVSMLALTLDVM